MFEQIMCVVYDFRIVRVAMSKLTLSAAAMKYSLMCGSLAACQLPRGRDN